MSYRIYIGEATLATDDEDEGSGVTARVQEVTHPEAALFSGDDMTGRSNCRAPGYGQWAGFCRDVGLYALFFHPGTDLMRQHPGCQVLKQKHLDEVEAALDKWRSTHHLPPGWDDPLPPEATTEEHIAWGNAPSTQRDPMLARLLWLQFWMKWALTTCKKPSIYNH